MSNNFPQNTYNQKQIKLRPIEIHKQAPLEEHESDVIDSELILKQNKLQELNRQLDEVKQQSDTLLKETQETIVNEKKKWEDTKEKLITDANEIGFKEGFQKGKEESISQYEELLTKANSIVDSAREDYHTTIESSEETILMLAIQSAEKIIKGKLIEQPETFVDIVKAAIKDIKEQSIISIYLHPDNYQVVLSQKEELTRLLDANSKLTVHVKDSLNVNDCLIEHPFGQVDASIDTQLKQLRAILHEVNMENKQ